MTLLTDYDILTTVTAADVAAVEPRIIAGVRAAFPALNLRTGTPERDLLVRPQAVLHAAAVRYLETGLRDASLADLAAAEETDAVRTAAAKLFDNVGITLSEGAPAYGTLRVTLSTDRDTTLPAGTEFTAASNSAVFKSVATVYAAASTKATVAGSETRLVLDAAGEPYVDVAVVCDEYGAAGNIATGVKFVPAKPDLGPKSAISVSTFYGGQAAETVAAAYAALRNRIAIAGTGSSSSITAEIMRKFPNTKAVGIAGMGHRLQLRDKDNAFGASRGGCVDAYVRTFGQPELVTVDLTGNLVSFQTYTVDVGAAVAPGYMGIHSVRDANDDVGSTPGGWTVTEARTAPADTAAYYRLASDTTNGAGTVFQAGRLTITGVNDAAASRTFRVTFYVAPGLAAIHAAFDAERQQHYSLLVRAPRLCMLSVRCVVSAATDVSDTVQQTIVDAINAAGMDDRMSVAMLIGAILRIPGVRDVGTGARFNIRAELHDGGAVTTSSGASISFPLLRDGVALATLPDFVSVTVTGSSV